MSSSCIIDCFCCLRMALDQGSEPIKIICRVNKLVACSVEPCLSCQFSQNFGHISVFVGGGTANSGSSVANASVSAVAPVLAPAFWDAITGNAGVAASCI